MTDNNEAEVRAMFEAVVSRSVPGYVVICIDDGHGFRTKFRNGLQFGNERSLHAILGGIKALVVAWQQGVPIMDLTVKRDR